MRFLSLLSRRGIAAAVLLTVTTSVGALSPAGAATPEMGFTQMFAEKYPSYGCPAQVSVTLQTAIRNWPDGDTTPHSVTYVIWRMRENGAIVKYKPVTAKFVPDTDRPENHWTTYDSKDADLSFGFDVKTRGVIEKYKLLIVKPFHHESDWMTVPVPCP